MDVLGGRRSPGDDDRSEEPTRLLALLRPRSAGEYHGGGTEEPFGRDAGARPPTHTAMPLHPICSGPWCRVKAPNATETDITGASSCLTVYAPFPAGWGVLKYPSCCNCISRSGFEPGLIGREKGQ